MKPTFSIGDCIASTCDDCMGLRWHGIVREIIPTKDAPDGFAYDTLGFWRVTNKSKLAFRFRRAKRPSLRQLWVNHLKADALATEHLNARLAALGLLPLESEQVALLSDPNGREQRRAMLEDLRDRCGVPISDAELEGACK